MDTLDFLRCLALDHRTEARTRCASAAEEDSVFCDFHKVQEVKLLKKYKQYNAEFEAFDDSSLCKDLKTIMDCESLEQIRAWNSVARQKWTIGYREMMLRTRHHDQFFAGGDEGHKFWLSSLSEKLEDLECFIEACDHQAYKLILAGEKASWVQEDYFHNEDNQCSDDNVSEPSCESDRSDMSDDDPYATKRARLISNLIHQLHCTRWILPPSSTSEEEQTDQSTVIAYIFRRIIVRSPNLFVRAHSGNFPDIDSFISDGDMSISELEKLSKKIRRGRNGAISAELIRNAIVDALRDQDDVSEGVGRVSLLGGWVYQKPSDQAMSRAGWDIFHQFIFCANCALMVCRSFEEWMRFQRLTIIGNKYCHWLPPFNWTLPQEIFQIFGIYYWDRWVGKTAVEKIVPKSKKSKVCYSETQDRNIVYLRMSANDRFAQPFMQAMLDAKGKYAILARNVLTGETLHDPSQSPGHPTDLWLQRSRSSFSPAQLRTSQWTITNSFDFGYMDYLNTCNSAAKLKSRFADVYEVAVLDLRFTSNGKFVRDIAEILCHVHGYKNCVDAITGEEMLAVDAGEISTHMCRPPVSGDLLTVKLPNAKYRTKPSTRSVRSKA
ncbi:hypothetical protein BD410DRAFT_156167 [Rickenella mellea]|uniref:Uncharacterized protein n=1 Tax=Rickenella mellea TaxID=50990 RepID=A0A4Y7PJ41_9AGAM|nr:hypothetical protein BD410DRAFT_156167 [Rickenella mellea]